MKILSIDPASLNGVHGWAYFHNSKLIKSGSYNFKGKNEAKIDKLISDMLEALKPDVLAVELQFLKNNVQTLIKLVEGRMYYQINAVKRNIKIELIEASKWQSTMLGKTKPRDTVKKLSVLRVKGVYKKIASEDEADAINLGEYYLNNLKIGGKHEIFD